MKLSPVGNLAFLIFFLKIDPILSACGEGTLACNLAEDTLDTPMHCDITMGYVISEDKKSCVVKKVEGCELAAYSEATKPCLLCEKGMVFDADNKKCVSVAEDKKIENCVRYDAKDSSCKECSSGFFFNVVDTKCMAVETKVENCAMYSDKETCSACEKDYYLSDKKCIQVPKIDDCYQVTDRVCDVCENDYILNRGVNPEVTVNDTFLAVLQAGALKTSIVSAPGNLSSVCQKEMVKNCLMHETFNTCKMCSKGFFLNASKLCERNPEPAIMNCEMYSDNITCTSCAENFYLTGDPTECKAITEVQNCKRYKNAEDKCAECNEEYFLDVAKNTCVQRTRKTIENCSSLSEVKDSCKICKANTTLTTPEGYQCLPDVENCKSGQMKNGGDSGTKHECNECKDNTFYIDDDKKCQLRNIDKCSVYQANTNTCQKCEETHYIDGNECKERTVENCKKFTENKNECDDCEANFVRESATSCTAGTVKDCTSYTKNTNDCIQCSGTMHIKNNACVQADISGCETHKPNEDKCQLCFNGYYLDGAGQCQPQAIDNCIKHVRNKDECAECSLGYHINNKACTVNTTVNCASYVPNTDKCATCAKGFYLDQSKDCVRQNVDGCIVYNDNANTCVTCQHGKYLKNDACVDVDVAGCHTYQPGTNICDACAISHYLQGVGENAVCVQRDVDNCVTYKANTNECTQCAFGYEVDQGDTCSKITKDHCVQLNASGNCTKCVKGKIVDNNGDCVDNTSVVQNCDMYSTTNSPGCEKCMKGYYLVDSDTCTQKNITNCVEYTNDIDQEKCETCDPTKLLKVNNDASGCEPIADDTGCVTSDGKTDNCTSCVPGKFLNSGTCGGNHDSDWFDQNCLDVTNTGPSTDCNSCKDGYLLADGLTKSAKNIKGNNCEKLKTNSSDCGLCQEGFNLNGDNNCITIVAAEHTQLCLQHKEESTKDHTDNTDCLKCGLPSLLYLDINDNYTCKSRGAQSNRTGCAIYSENEAKCLACDENNFGGAEVTQWACSPVAQVPLSQNCQVMADNTDCAVCAQGYKLNQNTPVGCDEISNHSVKVAYNAKMAPVPSIEAHSNVQNCEKYSQIFSNKIGCTKCAADYVGTIPYTQANTSNVLEFALAEHEDSYLPQRDIVNIFEKCLPKANGFKNGDGELVIEGTCAVGYTIDGFADGFACMQCIQGFIGANAVATLNHDDTSLNGNYDMVASCVQMTGPHFAKKLYANSGTFNPNSDGYQPRYTAYFPFDSCTDTGATDDSTPSTTLDLLYMYYPEASGFLRTSKQGSNNPNHPVFQNYYCLDTLPQDLNCKFFILKEELAENIPDMSTFDFTGKVVCGACKANHVPVIANNMITSCTAVDPSLLISPPATWGVNGTYKPMTNQWPLKLIDDVEVPDIYNPVAVAKSVANCLVVNTSLAPPKCIFCNKNFTLYQGKCVPSVLSSEDCTWVPGTTDFTVADTDYKKMIQFSLWKTFIIMTIDDDTKKAASSHCLSCGEGKTPRLLMESKFKVCEEVEPPNNVAADCKYVDPEDPSKCYECKSTHTKNTSNNTCIAKIDNCIETENGTECSVCADGYIVEDNACVKHYCKEFDMNQTSVCNLCDQRKDLVPGKNTRCSDQDSIDPKCEYNSPILGHCVKSLSSSQVPLIIKQKTAQGTAINVIMHHEGTTQGLGYGNIHNPYLYIEVLLDRTNNDTLTRTLMALNTNDYQKSTYPRPPGQQPAEKICMKERVVANCKAGYDGFFCQSCDDTYQPSNVGMCQDGAVPNCKVYDIDGCVECEADYFLNKEGSGNSICKDNVRTKSDATKCLTRAIDKDECETCVEGKYLNPNTKVCEDNTASGCATKDTTKNECKTCTWDFVLLENLGCLSFSAKNCKTRKSDANGCESCETGYYMNNNVCVPNDKTLCATWNASENKCASCGSLYNFLDSGVNAGSCQMKTASKCKSINTTDDTCLTCPAGYKKDSANCIWGDSENCGSYKDGSDQCETCSAMAFMKNSACELRKAADCKEFVDTADSDACKTCSDPTYLNNTTCTRPTEKNCAVTKAAEDKCETCHHGFKVNGSFTCDRDESGKCLEYDMDGACLSCAVGKYLNQSKACVENTATNCAKKSITSNVCETCAADHWKDAQDGNKCKVNDAENCETRSDSANECSKCATKHFKDEKDNNKCKPHTATNCDTYHLTSDECLTCKEGLLEGSSEGKKTCTEYQTQNCKTHNPTKDECATCDDKTRYKHNNGNINICKERTSENCSILHPLADECVRCESGYYLKDKNCVKSTEVENCDSYDLFKDECILCKTGWYLKKESKDCWLYPDGIAGCVEYSDRKTCLKCDTKSFLSDNKCSAVNPLVDGCIEYSSATDCKMCDTGKFLTGENKCVSVTATNCLELTDQATCKSCVDPYVFNPETKKCVSVGITGCAKGLFAADGNTCVSCDNGKVLSEDKKKCESPTTAVANCLVYESLTKCKTCSPGFIRNLAGTECKTIGVLAGANCSVASMVKDSVCDVCRFGFSKNSEGKCIKHDVEYCLVPTADKKKCQFCRPGTFMDKSGLCQMKEVTETKDISIYKHFFMLLSLFLLLTGDRTFF